MPMGADTVGGEDESGTAPATAETIVRALADGGFDAEFFREVVERVGVGVGVYDASGRFTYANQSFADMLARPVEEVVGTRVWEVNPASKRSPSRAGFTSQTRVPTTSSTGRASMSAKDWLA